MVQFHVDFWGPKLELTNEDVQTLSTMVGDATRITTFITGALAAGGPTTAWVVPAIAVITAYINLNMYVITRVNQGNGVWLTLPWPAIALGQWWLVVPTTR
jgi:hypothetical protein